MASIKHKGWKWSVADASNPALVAVLDNTSKALHITDAEDQSTDWNVAADSHPSVYIHSATTPATDYLKLYHDGDYGYIDAVGGSLMLAVAGTNEVVLTASAMSPATSDGNALGTTALMWGDLFLASLGVINFNNGDVTITHAAGFLSVGDNMGFRLGATGDDVLYHRTATLAAGTAITSVIVGTPVKQALAADSFIISNVTASGDIGIYVNNGGNSLEVLMADASAGTAKIGHGLAGLTLSMNSGALTLDSVSAMVFQIGAVDILQLDDAAISGFAGAADTAGQDLYGETEDGGAASADTAGVVGGLFSLKMGDGSAGGAHTANNPAGGAGGALTVATGIGGVSGAAGSGNGGAGGTLSITGGAGGAVAGDGTGVGGAGGSIVLTAGAGGGAGGGTAGAPGNVRLGAGIFRYMTAQTIDMADGAVTLTLVPGTPAGTLITSNVLYVDANSSTTENLLLPPEGNWNGGMLIIVNTGGETINIQNDAGGAVLTLETANTAFVVNDGTTLRGVVGIP